jgi:hypothetical protein
MVVASVAHVRDLPAKEMAVDLQTFEPTYQLSERGAQRPDTRILPLSFVLWRQRNCTPRSVLVEGDFQFDDRSRRNGYVQDPCAHRATKRRDLYSIRILECVVCVHVACC